MFSASELFGCELLVVLSVPHYVFADEFIVVIEICSHESNESEFLRSDVVCLFLQHCIGA